MSERKRLTHNEMARRWESLKLGRADLAEHEDALEADHLQAREDVKRLVVMLRGDAVTRTDGALCWCCDGRRDEACWDEPDGGSIFCRERRALLSEVTTP